MKLKIFGAILERGGWKRTLKSEIRELFGEQDVVGVIRGCRLRWAIVR